MRVMRAAGKVMAFSPRGEQTSGTRRDRGVSLEIESKQAELLGCAARGTEVLGAEPHLALVEVELLAGELEPAPDHPRHRAGPLHAASPAGIVVLAAAHVADELEHV